MKKGSNRVIRQSKNKFIGVTLTGILFAILAYLAIGATADAWDKFMLWIGVAGSSGVGLSGLFFLLHPRTRFEPPPPPKSKEEAAEDFKRKLDDPGIFSYTEDGFILKEENEMTEYAWEDIDTIFGYKKDLMTYDTICMDIFTNGKGALRVCEETNGWYVFNKKLSENLPSIDAEWYWGIVHPAFKTNLTLLFDRQGRSLSEAEAACYSG